MKNREILKVIVVATILCLTNKLFAQPNIVWIVSEDNSKHFMQTFDTNGAPTPNIQSLAEGGLMYHNAFSNSAVCSAARSTLISGCYGPRLGTHYHRKMKKVSFPADLQPWPKYLKDAGYYTTNNSKTDYNMNVSGAWNQSSGNATWRNRAPGQPFFHVQNYMTSHESSLFGIGTSGSTTTDQESVYIPPIHPETGLFKYTYAKYHDKMMAVDGQVKSVVDKLKEDGLLESTFIFYYGDHGGVLPGSKGYLFETGLNVPLVVRIPEDYREQFKLKAGTEVDGFVSFVDFGATILHLAGLAVPDQMDGTPFLGETITLEEVNKRDSTFSYADRHGEKFDMVRAYRKGKYKYIRNYQPFNFDGLYNEYRYKMDAFQQWKDLYDNGELNEVQSAFFKRKAPEALYDIEADPYETNNLAGTPGYESILKELRNDLTAIVKDLPDLGFYPESHLIEHAFDSPVEFGQTSKAEIQDMVDISNLSLQSFESVKADLLNALNSGNQWYRYWGLISCSSHLTTDSEIVSKAKQLVENDAVLLVRMRAAEYLALIEEAFPQEAFLDILSKSSVEMEAALILNSVAMLMDGEPGYLIKITLEDLHSSVRGSAIVNQRINYISKQLSPTGVKAEKGDNNTVTIRWGSKKASETGIILERSINGSSFAEIARFEHTDTHSYIDTINDQGVYQYRLKYFNSRGTDFDYSETASLSPSTDDNENIALNKSTTVSSTLNSSYTGSNAVDGNNTDNSSRWISEKADYPHWIEVDFGGKHEISLVKLWTGYNGYNKPLVSFKFQKWNGTDWEDIFSESSNSLAEYVKVFEPDTTSKVRLYITSGEDNTVRLYELEVYGKEVKLTQTASSYYRNIELYPNPVTGDYINISGIHEEVLVEIFTIQGTKIKSLKTRSRVQVADLKQGVYFLVINGVKTFRFVK